MRKKPDLLQQAFDFADGSLADLLNRTITHGIKISVALLEDDGRCIIGNGITRKKLIPQIIPLTIDAKQPRAYLDLWHTLYLSPRGFLGVASSV